MRDLLEIADPSALLQLADDLVFVTEALMGRHKDNTERAEAIIARWSIVTGLPQPRHGIVAGHGQDSL